jgi:Tfp pilus assembly protein PilN
MGQNWWQKLTERLGSKKVKTDEFVPPTPASALEVNLIPQEVVTASWVQLWPLIGAVGGALVVISATYIILGLSVSAKQSALMRLQEQAATTAAQLYAQKDQVEEMSRAAQQVKVVRGLLDNHVYWTKFFDWLEKATLADVYFSGFMGDVAGKFTLTASARDYVTLAQQLVSLQADPNVQQAIVSEASRDSQGWVNFSLTLVVSPPVFVKTPP